MFNKIVGFISLFVGCAAFLSGCATDDNTISISLIESWSYDIKSQNPVKIEKGSSASFVIDFKDNYGFDAESNVDCYFQTETKSVIFPNRTESAKVSFYVKRQTNSYSFKYSFESTKGNVASSHNNGSYAVNTDIVVTATPNSGFYFVGWSLNNYLTDSNSTLLSADAEHSFKLIQNISIYANFLPVNANEYAFRYDGNGGLTENNATEYICIHKTTYQHIFINTLLGTNYFSRDGYTLESWNTESNGGGQRVGLGSRIPPKEDYSEQVLYAQWAKWEDSNNFEYSTNESGISLTKYNGSSSVLIIPEKIGASFVTIIESNFLISGNIEKVIFPKSLERVENGAFSSCNSLASILFFDSLTYIDEASFNECPNLSRLFVNAVGLPKYIWSLTAKVADMIDKISITTDKKKMMFAADSLVAVGINSPAIYEALGGEYQLFNLGSEGLTSMSCILSLVEPYIGDGDIFIDCNNYSSNGDVTYSNKWVIFEANYDLLASIDLTHKETGMAGKWLWGFTDFNKTRSKLTGTSYEHNINFNNLNEFGDVFYNDSGHGEDWKASSGYQQYFRVGTSKNNVSFHNAYAQRFLAKGGKTYRSFPSWNINAVEEGYAVAATFDAYMNTLSDYLDYPIISHPSEFGLTGQYFATDDFHVCQPGAVKHTEIIIKDLKAQLAKEN